MTVGETYESFKADHPECALSMSKVAALRPEQVLLTSKLPPNVCGCKYHNNIILSLEILYRRFPETVPVYSSDFLNIHVYVCDYSNEDCMSDSCEKCKNGILLKQNLMAKITHLDALIEWYQWQEDIDIYLSKVEHVGTVQEALDSLVSQLSLFTWRVFIKRKQARSYEEDKELAEVAGSDTCVV